MSVQVVKLERPNPRQEEFLKCEKKYVAFGGARGGGKSWAVRTKAVLMALKYPGIRILLVRRTMPELESNHLRFLRRQLAGVAEYKAASRQLVFPGGSVLELGYCACDGDMDRYQGAEFDVICIDEATQLKEEWLRQFAACLRGVNEFPKRMYYTCNPGGPGHGYIKRLFIDRRYRAGERAEEYAFIPAKVTDNQALLRAQPDYLRQLEALPQRLRQAWLEGKWDVFQGQFFQEFVDDPAHYRDRRFTHVIEPFDIPREWSIWRSYDFGYVCILHPSVAFDLRQDEAWIAAHQYAAATELFSGEIGELHGVRFVETTEAKIFRGGDLAQNGRTLLVNGKVENNAVVAFDGGTVAAGALAGRYVLLGGERRRVVSNTGSSMTLDSAVTAADNAVIYPGEGGAEGCAVYGCLFVGKGAYGVVDLNDGTEVIVKPRGSSGTADPLDQRSSVGWKGVHAAAILYDEYIVRVECGSSYSGQDKAN